jgi:hypothetical protein
LIGEFGLPINEEAFVKFIQPEKETEEPLYSSCVTTREGTMFTSDIYAATKKEREDLLEYAKSVTHPYLKDSVVESAIVEYGVDYLKGKQSLEEALQKIDSKISIYLAE